MSIRKVVTRNGPLKLWSLLIGILMYLGIHALIQTEQTLEIPLKFNLADNQLHVDQRSRRIRLSVKGPKTQIEALDRGALTAQISLDSELPGGGSAGRHTVTLHRRHLSQLPGQVDVVFLTPTVEVELTQMKTVKVLVRPILELDTPFEVSLRYARPQSVTIQGPQSTVEKLESLETLPARDKIEYISLNQIEVDMLSEIDGVPITVTPSRVTLHLNVSEKQEEVILQGVPVSVLTHPGDVRQITLEHNAIDLVVTGPPKLMDGTLLKEVDPKSFVIFVDARDLPVTDPTAPPARKVQVTSKYGSELSVSPKEHAFIRVTVQGP